MGSFRIPALPSVPMEQALADMGESAKGHLRSGFNTIAGLEQSKIEILAREAIEHIDSLAELDTDRLAEDLGIDAEQANPAISATSISVALISSRRESATEIAAGLVKAGLLGTSEEPAVSRFLGIVASRRVEIKKTLGLRSLADETLPAFRGFETSIDVRLDFKKDQIETVVPVLLVHLRTDLSMERIFFQMTKSDVHRLLEQLSEAVARLEVAERWALERLPEGD